jgi:cell shape-determining protein MreD
MRYLYFILIFFIASFLFQLLNFYDNGWQFLQPFLIATLLVYFNSSKEWLHYMFAMLAGFFVDSFTGIFGLHAVIFVLIIFILKTFQVTILTSKNILAIIILTLFSFLLFWLLFWFSDFVFNWDIYTFQNTMIRPILKMMSINIFLVIFLHLIYYNFWLKGHDKKQSF